MPLATIIMLLCEVPDRDPGSPGTLDIMRGNIMRSPGSRSWLAGNLGYYEGKYYTANAIIRGGGYHELALSKSPQVRLVVGERFLGNPVVGESSPKSANVVGEPISGNEPFQVVGEPWVSRRITRRICRRILTSRRTLFLSANPANPQSPAN